MNEQKFHKVFTCEGHISSVRCLTYINVHLHSVQETHCYKHLLFSGGSRASLKCWSLDVDSISSNEVNGKSSGLNPSLNSSCTLLAELRGRSRRPQRKKRFGSCKDEEFTSDIRFMSLNAFPATDLLPSAWIHDGVCPPAVGVVAACSDGYLRYCWMIAWKIYFVKCRSIDHSYPIMTTHCPTQLDWMPSSNTKNCLILRSS